MKFLLCCAKNLNYIARNQECHNLFKIYLFNVFQLCWVLVAVYRPPLVVKRRAFQWAAFPLRWLLLVRSPALECRLRRLQHLGSAVMLHGTWNLPGPGIEPVSPAPAGGCLSTVPPGKSIIILKKCQYFSNTLPIHTYLRENERLQYLLLWNSQCKISLRQQTSMAKI